MFLVCGGLLSFAGNLPVVGTTPTTTPPTPHPTQADAPRSDPGGAVDEIGSVGTFLFWFGVTLLVSLSLYVFRCCFTAVYGRVLFQRMQFARRKLENLGKNQISVARKLTSVSRNQIPNSGRRNLMNTASILVPGLPANHTRWRGHYERYVRLPCVLSTGRPGEEAARKAGCGRVSQREAVGWVREEVPYFIEFMLREGSLDNALVMWQPFHGEGWDAERGLLSSSGAVALVNDGEMRWGDLYFPDLQGVQTEYCGKLEIRSPSTTSGAPISASAEVDRSSDGAYRIRGEYRSNDGQTGKFWLSMEWGV